MILYDNATDDILSLFSYFGAQYMIKSLLFRKQAKIIVAENSAMIIWGPSFIIGGEFSQSMSETLNEALHNSKTTHYINSPEGEWKSYITSTFSGNLVSKYINLYQADGIHEMDCQTNPQYITPITRTWFELALPNSQHIKDELYSYTSEEDFFQNGFGLALVIDGIVCGYCLSEYSIDNECAITIWVDPKYRGLGYAKTMTNQFLMHNNNNWNIFWACNSDNIPSNRVALSSGFVLHSKQSYFEWKKL
jgi:RimJ/RimL family protein N-acetyltransferase